MGEELFWIIYGVVACILFIVGFYIAAEDIVKPHKDTGTGLLMCCIFWPVLLVFLPLVFFVSLVFNFAKVTAVKLANKIKERRS